LATVHFGPKPTSISNGLRQGRRFEIGFIPH
jgi:hypothetical protein